MKNKGKTLDFYDSEILSEHENRTNYTNNDILTPNQQKSYQKLFSPQITQREMNNNNAARISPNILNQN